LGYALRIVLFFFFFAVIKEVQEIGYFKNQTGFVLWSSALFLNRGEKCLQNLSWNKNRLLVAATAMMFSEGCQAV